MNHSLDLHQKYNLHLLLRASLKKSHPIEAMERIGIDPAVFTDIFLRADKNREVSYGELEKFSHLCCWVIQWKVNQLPEVDCDRTYAGQTELLLHHLSNNALKN